MKLMGARISLLWLRLIYKTLPAWWFVSGTAIHFYFVVQPVIRNIFYGSQPIIRNAFANTKYVLGRTIALTLFHGFHETIRRIVLVYAYSRIIVLALLGNRTEQGRIRKRWRKLRSSSPSGQSN